MTRERLAGGDPPPHILREYALLADGERGIIVGPRGEFAFMCFPSWSDDALFATLIGGSGTYSVAPVERFVWGGYYEPGTLIWRSRWATESGMVECREALALPSQPARAVLLRRVVAVAGAARVEVVLDPRAEFGAKGLRSVRQDDEGVWRGRVGELSLAWRGAEKAQPLSDGHGGRRGSDDVAARARRATASRRPAGSSETALPAGRPGCSPRNSTYSSASSGGTSLRPSCTLSCSSLR